jgi:catalase
MRYENPGDPVYAPNSYGGPAADAERAAEPVYDVTGELVRAANSLHSEDDDFTQPGELYRKVLSETDRDHLVSNIVAHATDGVSVDTQKRVAEYWRQVDPDLGARVAKGLGNGG